MNPMNQPDQVKLRRYRNLLILSGTGSMFFGLWTVVKTVMLMLTHNDFISQITGEDSDVFYHMVFYIVITALMLWILGLRVYIGLCARSEGRGKKKRWFYLVVAILMLVTDVYFFMDFSLDAPSYTSVYDVIVSFFVDLTSMITLGEMIVSSIIVKRLSKKTATIDMTVKEA